MLVLIPCPLTLGVKPMFITNCIVCVNSLDLTRTILIHHLSLLKSTFQVSPWAALLQQVATPFPNFLHTQDLCFPIPLVRVFACSSI